MTLIDGVEVRPITGFEGLYSASSDGRIWAHPKRMARASHAGRWLRHGLTTRGYPMVVLLKHPIRKTRTVHRLIAEAWIAPALPGLEVNHKNGIKTDNRAENLEWVTRSANLTHAWATGLRRAARRPSALRHP